MKAITNIYERKLIKDSITKMPSQNHVDILKGHIETFNNTWNMTTRRSIECLVDIILTNPDSDIMSLFSIYRTSKNQYEKVLIRHGQEAVDELKDKYTKRPNPRVISHFTKDYWLNRGFSEKESIAKVREVQRRNSKNRHSKATPESYKNIPHCVEYWINKGFTLEEAIVAKTEFNQKHARSYENAIKKYGDQLGLAIMLDSQAKRKETLLSRYGTTTFGNNTSKSSMRLFIPLYKRLRKDGLKKEDIYWGITGSKEFAMHCNGKNYFYDFTVKSLKIIIEYNGCYWHGRDDIEWRRQDISKEESMSHDNLKRQIMQDRGYKVFTVWEDDNIVYKLEELYNIINDECTRTRLPTKS